MRAALVLLLLTAASAHAQAPPGPASARPATRLAPASPPLETLKADLAGVEAKLAAHEEAQKERDRLARSKGALSGMTMDDMLAMQKLMDRKAELEKAIANTTKAASGPDRPAQVSRKPS